jgi:Pentapeptide repeats (8 copies)
MEVARPAYPPVMPMLRNARTLPGMDPALTAAVVGVGGTVIVGVAGFWANVRNTNKLTGLAEQGQLTDRYSKAIEQLGSKELDVRIGGIYALERIARDSPRDHPTIMEVLAAFIRDHSHEPWPPAKDGTQPPARTMRPDVRAAATVIRRRNIRHDSKSIDLGGFGLASRDYTDADLTFAYLAGTTLTSANLAGADLNFANLRGARLDGAHLTNAHLTGADLRHANVIQAHLTGADLTLAVLANTDLRSADLRDADLTFADLRSADLTGALWPPSAIVPEGWQRDPATGRLKRSEPDSGDAAAEQV